MVRHVITDILWPTAQILGVIVIGVTLSMAGCATPPPRVIARPVHLPMPTTAGLPMPSVMATDWLCPRDVALAHPDLYCVTHKTYKDLATRQHSRRIYEAKLRATIRANNRTAAAKEPVDGRD